MKYQLVLQWPNTSGFDYDRLIELEDILNQGLGGAGIVDGHDLGSGEMNIFIHTNSPQSAFEKAISLIKGQDGLNQLKAGYRDFDRDEYVPIHPIGLKQFSAVAHS